MNNKWMKLMKASEKGKEGINYVKNEKIWHGQMTQQVRYSPTGNNDLSLITGTLMVERGNQFLCIVFWPLQAHGDICSHIK